MVDVGSVRVYSSLVSVVVFARCWPDTIWLETITLIGTLTATLTLNQSGGRGEILVVLSLSTTLIPGICH
jgi:hypothetical protein